MCQKGEQRTQWPDITYLETWLKHKILCVPQDECVPGEESKTPATATAAELEGGQGSLAMAGRHRS